MNVLVIGAGAAGARTAIELAKRGSDPEDDRTVHATDTLEKDHVLTDPGEPETVWPNWRYYASGPTTSRSTMAGDLTSSASATASAGCV